MPTDHPPIKLLEKVKVLTGQRAGQLGCVVDYSDSHGLCYRVVFPNLNGAYSRKDWIESEWLDPEQIEKA